MTNIANGDFPRLYGPHREDLNEGVDVSEALAMRDLIEKSAPERVAGVAMKAATIIDVQPRSYDK